MPRGTEPAPGRDRPAVPSSDDGDRAGTVGVQGTEGNESGDRRPAAEGVTMCVINHDGERYLPDSLAAARTEEAALTEVIMVDDASADGSVQLVRDEFPEVRVVRLPENVGPAAARNAALRAARTDRVLIVDNDVRIGRGCVELLRRALERHRDVAAVVPTVLYEDRPDTVQYDGADCHYLGLQILEGEDRPVESRPARTRALGSLVSACVMVDRSLLPRRQPFDEDYFIYFEDHDFGVRIRARGHRILSVPEARCYHGEGTPGLSIREVGGYSRRRVFYLVRNRWIFILKMYRPRTLLLLGPMLAFYEAAQLAVVAAKGWLRPWARAVSWMVQHLPRVLRKRKAVQERRAVSDRSLLTGGPVPFREELTRGPIARAAKRLLDRIAVSYWKIVERAI